MKIYESVYDSLVNLIENSSKKELSLDNAWSETDKNDLIFKGDTAYELGGGILPGLAGVILTDNETRVNKNEIVLIGKDLNEISKDTAYARIALVKVNPEKMGEGHNLYQTIRRIDYTRYKFYPEGYMILISPMNQKESVRISKKALKKGLSFSKVGKLFIDAYLKNPMVENVKMIFITEESFNYPELSNILTKNENITSALDHLLNKVKMDCHTCGLKVVCEEVEKITEEEFGKKKEE